MGDEFLFGDTIASVDAFEGVSDVVDADGDELGLGKRTPSKEMPLTSSFTTSWGSPVDEFSVTRRKVSQLINKFPFNCLPLLIILNCIPLSIVVPRLSTPFCGL